MVEASGQVDTLAAEEGAGHGTVPYVELKAMVETPVHPWDQNLGIPPQEATSAFVRLIYHSLINFLP